MRHPRLVAVILCCAALLFSCSSTPVVDVVPEPTLPQVEVYVPPEPVAHEGPVSVDLDVYDCGEIPVGYTCEFESIVTQTTDHDLIISQVAQNFSPYARVDLVEDSTAFGRDLPYTMLPDDVLRVIFVYRRDDPDEEIGGSVFISYQDGSTEYELEIPIGVRD